MPAPSPFALHGQTMYPALFLYPLNDSFIPKHITLAGGQRVKIGRQTNAKTVPAERNGYFDSKVLSRQHAEVWEEAGKIYIKDVKSSNGTFINGERLSPEGLESDPFELKTEDIVEFGIDIVGEDNKTIVHHKVAARVACVFNDQDAANAARSDNVPPHSLGIQSQAGPSNGSAFNFAGGQQGGGPGTQRRPALQPQGLGGMGGLGAMRAPGKSGLTFDHIISRLQGELQKSRETGAELHNLTGHMNDIHDTLGGSLPQSLPPYPPNLPPVRPPQAALPAPADGPDAAPSAPALSDLQAQLRETQSSLAGHVDKIRALESVIAEHEVIKREVSSLRESIEEHRRSSLSPPQGRSSFDDADEQDEQSHDDDDARSVATVTPGELERVDEEDEEQVLREQQAEDEERRRRRDELGRPRTPEPTGMGMGMEDDEHEQARGNFVSRGGSSHDALSDRLNTLANQLETALELSRSLQVQHAQQQDTITTLQEKIAALEGRADDSEKTVAEQVEAIEALRAAPPTLASSDSGTERESLTEMVNEWKKSVEGQWGGVREAWESERERLRKASEEYERRAKEMEASVRGAIDRVDTGLERVEALAREHTTPSANGDVKHAVGLVTPPSPRSLSSDSARSRPRRRRTSRSSSRGRPSSPSGSSGGTTGASDGLDTSGSSEGGASSLATSFSESPKRPRAPWGPGSDEREDGEEEPPAYDRGQQGAAARNEGVDSKAKVQYPLTPKASVDEAELKKMQAKASAESGVMKPMPADVRLSQYSAAIGVIALSVAAAAVIYRVKPDLPL